MEIYIYILMMTICRFSQIFILLIIISKLGYIWPKQIEIKYTSVDNIKHQQITMRQNFNKPPFLCHPIFFLFNNSLWLIRNRWSKFSSSLLVNRPFLIIYFFVSMRKTTVSLGFCLTTDRSSLTILKMINLQWSIRFLPKA